ncbi:ABC transporter permease [Clavibacter michiganensis subsp. insidiosus]|nr:ABC transporter permease [Clavibacter michiganensis subsp. insidiosus]AWG01148.1 ABC transporter permease [Clavibacter michiganensis subsp. insidiosus]
MTASVLRALPAGLLLLAIRSGLPPRGWRVRTAVLGMLNIGFFFPLLFIAAYRLPGGLASVVGALQPILIIGLTLVLRWGRPSNAHLLGGLVALIGVSLVSVNENASFDALGFVAAVLGTVSMASGILLTRRWGTPPNTHPLNSTAWQLIVGGVAIIPLIPIFDSGPWEPTAAGVAGYAWLTLVGGALAYSLWFRGARALPSTGIALLGVLSPVTAATLGWVLLGQELSPLQVVGFVIALGGSLGGQLTPAYKTRPVLTQATS